MTQVPFPTRDVALSAVAVNYARINGEARGYIADQVAPRIRVNSSMFRWYRSKLERAFEVVDTQIDRLGRANEIVQLWDEDTGATVDHALREPVSYRDEAEAAAQSLPFNLLEEATYNVVDKVMLRREQRVATLAMSSSSYLAGYVTDLTSGTKWNDFANSDPVAAITDARTSMLFPGNVGVTSQRVANILARHPKVAVALGGSLNSGRYYPMDEVAGVLGLDRIIVGNTLRQTSKPGQTLTTGQIWPDSFAIHYQGATGPDGMMATRKTPNFLATFSWTGWITNRKQVPPGDMGLFGGVYVLAGESLVEKQIAQYAGWLFQNVL